jgi:hypothetical protein
MGVKVTVDEIENVGHASGLPTINENFEELADEFDLVHYRDGSQAATGNWDMDSNRILNLPPSSTVSEPITRGEMNTIVLEFLSAIASTYEIFASTAEGLAATSEGENFMVITSGNVSVYENNAGSADEVYVIPTASLLSAGLGSSEIGYISPGV